MRRLLLASLLVFFTTAAARGQVLEVREVDVYDGGALMRLAAEAEGEMAFELPATLDKSTLAVAGSGGAEVLHWTVEERPAPAWLPPALEELRDEVDRARTEVDLLDARTAALKQAAGHLERALPEGADGEELDDFVDGALRKREALELRLRETETLRARAQADLEGLERLLKERRPETESLLLLVLSTEGEGTVEVTAWSDRAGWRPLYRVDLDSATGRARWRLDGLVTQKTGLSWEGPVAFHSGAPRRGLNVPDLPPLAVDIRPPFKAARTGMEAARLAMDSVSFSEAPAEERLETATDVILKGTASVPGDGREVRVGLEGFSLEGEAELTLFGELSPRAWLLWKTERLDRALLPGQAELFVDGLPSGRTALAERSAGQKLEMPFGESPLVTVAREELLPQEGSSWTGRGRLERGYRLTVSNGLNREQTVTVRDRLPVSVNEKVKVEPVTVAPEPSERDDEGRLTWKVTLEGGGRAEITVRYRLFYPGDSEIYFYGGTSR